MNHVYSHLSVTKRLGAKSLAVFSWIFGLAMGLAAPTSLVPLPDGRVLVAGTFLTIGGQPATNLVRLNPDLSIDPTFQPDPLFLRSYNKISTAVVLPDGKILLRGSFSPKKGYSAFLNRLNADGSHDGTFATSEGTFDTDPFYYATDVKIDGNTNSFVAGFFDVGEVDYREQSRLLMRLRPDGTREPLFAANRTAFPLIVANNLLNVVQYPVVQITWEGRVLMGGLFAENDWLGQRHHLHSFSSDGIPEFQTGSDFDVAARAIAEDQQGRILVAGTLYSAGVASGPGWVRLNADGTTDASFDPASPLEAVIQMESLRNRDILAFVGDGHLLNEYADNGALIGTLSTNVTAFAVESSGTILAAVNGGVQRLTTMSDNASPQVEVVWGSLSISEGAGEARVSVRRTGNADIAASVGYTVTAGSAIPGVDFIPTNGVVSFDPGVREAAIVVPLTAQNQVPNDDRTIEVGLTTATGATLHLVRTHCTVTLKDDDTGLTAETFRYTPTVTFPPPSLLLPQSYFQKRLSTRIDPVAHQDWGSSEPPGASNNTFSAIWTGWIVPETNGVFSIGTITKNGSRLWLDDRLVLDNWIRQYSMPTALLSTNVPLLGGHPYRVVLQYEAGNSVSVCRLVWQPPGATNFSTIPQRDLRPGSSRLIPPILHCSTTDYRQFTVQYGGDSERPILIEMTTNGTQWTLLGEGIVRTNGTTESFSTPASTTAGTLFPYDTQFRATTIDGLVTLYSQDYSFSASGSLNLAAGSTNSVTLSASWGPPGSSVVWQRDGLPIRTNFLLTVSGTDANAAGTYQAIITTPQGVTNSPAYTIHLFQVPLVSPTLISSIPLAHLSGPQTVQVNGNYVFWIDNPTSPFQVYFAHIFDSNAFDLRSSHVFLPSNSVISPDFDTFNTATPDGTFYDYSFDGVSLWLPWSLTLPDPGVLSMASGDGVAYVSHSSRAVDILLSISALGRPRLLGTYPAPFPVTSIQVLSGIAYLAGRDGGLEIVDVRNPRTPVRLGMLDTSPLVNLKVSGSHLYATSATNDLMIIDVSDPVAPQVTAVQPLRGTPLALSVRGNRAAVALGSAGAAIFDISNPSLPIIVGNLTGEILALDMDGRHLYAVGSDKGFSVWDLGSQAARNLDFSPASPVLFDGAPIPLTATGGSRDIVPASYRVISGPAMISSNQLVFTGIGKAVVESTLDGDATYLPTVGVQRSLQALASLQISPDAVRWNGAGRQQVTFPTAPGGLYDVQSSEDLVHWTSHGIATATDDTTTFTNLQSKGITTFLRVHWQ